MHQTKEKACKEGLETVNDNYQFPDLEDMKKLPELSLPDYQELNKRFIEAVHDPANKIYRTNPQNGHPIFGAYTLSNSNEMVTWGILAIGEWLMNRDTKWIAPTYFDFYSQTHRIFLNSPDVDKVEYWYLFYVNLLAGAVYRTLYDGEETAKNYLMEAASSMKKLAKSINYDFYAQGFDFTTYQSFTNRDIFCQPDSMAGYAYQMLFASQILEQPDCLEESVNAIRRYQAYEKNPWYEIPNGSAGVLAAAWLQAHGYENDVEKTAFWIFDNENGPLQKGNWGDECVNGLMMGWRGESRKDAMDSAYSMESLMPMQLLLPSVRYCPALAEAVSNWVRHVMSSFQLYYGQGKTKLKETRPELSSAVPYERLQRLEGEENPVACGDFDGHRSVYGAGYLMWLDALVRNTDREWIYALDLSVTDWLSRKNCPVYLIQNPLEEEITVQFTAADIWKKKRPDLFENAFLVWELPSVRKLGIYEEKITVTLKAKEYKFMAISKEMPLTTTNFICGADGEELLYTGR